MHEEERTFVAIKPDGVKRGFVGEIISRFEKKGYKLIGMKLLQVTEEIAANITQKQVNITNLQTRMTTAESNISTNSENISKNTSDIEELKRSIGTGEFFVGTLEWTSETLPTDVELNAFVYETLQRNQQNGDSIIVIQKLPNQIDRNYKYLYATDKWTDYELSPMELAGNGKAGLMNGTYGIGKTNNLLVDIINGEIVTIYYKDNNGNYQNLQTKINLLELMQNNFIDGSQIVGIAQKAIADQLGNTINTTYAVAENYYTKAQSDERYLSANYTNVYHYSADGIVDDVPTTPESGLQGEVTINSIGETLIFDLTKTLEGNYNWNKNSSDNSVIWGTLNIAGSCQFRLETYLKKQGQQEQLLSSALSETISFTGEGISKFNIQSIFSALGSSEIKAETGDVFRKKLYLISDVSTLRVFKWYCNSSYDSTMQLNAQSIDFNVNEISNLAEISIAESDWTENDDGTYSVTIPQSRHQQPPTNRYLLDLQIINSATAYESVPFSKVIDKDSGNITITSTVAISCVLLIASGIDTEEKTILTVTNPTTAPTIDYTKYGSLRVVQTQVATPLTLNNPIDVSKFYTFYVSNSNSSTKNITFNNEEISPGSGVQLKWNGAEWQVGEQPTDTDEVYDKNKSQLLSVTLSNIEQNQEAIEKALLFYYYEITQTNPNITALEGNKLFLRVKVSTNNESLAITLPSRTANKYLIIDVEFETGVETASITISPASGETINGSTDALVVNKSGLVGSFIPLANSNGYINISKMV